MTEASGIKIADRRAAYIEDVEEKPSASNQAKSPTQNTKAPETTSDNTVPPGMTSKTAKNSEYTEDSEDQPRQSLSSSPAATHITRLVIFMLELLLQKAFASMGLIPIPETGRRERDMQQAKTTIDLIGAIAETMRGRWGMPGIEQEVDTQLMSLKLKYAKLAPDSSDQA